MRRSAYDRFDGDCALRYNTLGIMDLPRRIGMNLGLRRLLLVVLSVLGGIALVFVMFAILNAAFPTADITLERFGNEYFALSALPLALLVGLWLDYFMRTGIIPEDEGKQPAAKKGGARAAAAAAAPPAEE
jgi:hypothetical protein